MKHTPGPWRMTEPQTSYDDWYIVGQDDEDVGVAWNYDRVEDEANARLIAAAPELLEALEVIEWIRGFATGDWKFCPSCKSWEHKGHLPDCRIHTAIAKAKGEEE